MLFRFQSKHRKLCGWAILLLCLFSAPVRAQTLQWGHQFGSSNTDFGYGIAMDATGGYVVGHTWGTISGQTGTFDAFIDAFVRKYDSNGAEVWTQEFGNSSGGDKVSAMTADATGIYVAGTTCCAPLSGQTSSFGLSDGFIRKFSSRGTVLWTRQFGTAGSDRLNAIAVDNSGVYVAGTTGCGLSGSTRVCPNLG